MQPALSIILFTVASGAGYGLIAVTGVLAAAGVLAEARWLGVAALSLALVLVAAGLIASTRHLSHPERAWRAFSQWQSSWLSREGVAALASFVPAGLLWLALLWGTRAEEAVAPLGLAAAALALTTVACTAMIYRSLKPVRQWDNRLVLPNYLALALMTGALWFAALSALAGAAPLLPAAIALLAIACAALLKRAYWSAIDRAAPVFTAAAATGLRGPVRLFEAPHTQENYLLKEMGFRIARKHAKRLRRIAALLGFALPFLLSAATLLGGSVAAPAALLAALSATTGVLVERWLFFAEATHTVTLYYGAAAV
jgi:sulfite dehydrogenase (quinone) subunit SoeC